jgi:hypothetical protein
VRLLPVALALVLLSAPGPLLASDRTPTTTSLNAPAVAHYPEPIQVQASVDPSTSGELEVRSGNTPLVRGSLSSGKLVRNVVLAPGEHSLRADFLGSATHQLSASAAHSIQSYVRTATHLRASPTSAFFGQRIQLYASTEVAGSYRLTGGTLSIVDLGTGQTLASAAVEAGELEVRAEVHLFEAGTTREFEARYSGHGLLGSSTRKVSVTTKKRSTSVIISGPTEPIYPGPFTFNAQVLPVPESGEITFARGNVPLGTVPLDRHGRASITVDLSPGPGSVSATFSGSPGYSDNWTSQAVTVRVETAVELTATPVNAKAGDTIQFKGVVHALRGAPPVTSGATMANPSPPTTS